MATFFNKQSDKKTELTEQEIEQLWQQITERSKRQGISTTNSWMPVHFPSMKMTSTK